MAAPVRISQPTLENGDRLSQQEFHRRYELRPDLHGVELIEGVVYLPSPASSELHGRPTAMMVGWLFLYELSNPEVRVEEATTFILDDGNEVQPDALLIRRNHDQSGPRGYIYGAPDLIVEVSASSASKDLGPKKTAYERNGVREYIVWRTEDRVIDWFVLESGQYRRREPDASGPVASVQFPGLRLDVEAMLAGDSRRVAAALDADRS